MYTMKDYRAALAERDSNDMGSGAWNLSQAKITAIVSVLVACGDVYKRQILHLECPIPYLKPEFASHNFNVKKHVHRCENLEG